MTNIKPVCLPLVAFKVCWVINLIISPPCFRISTSWVLATKQKSRQFGLNWPLYALALSPASTRPGLVTENPLGRCCHVASPKLIIRCVCSSLQFHHYRRWSEPRCFSHFIIFFFWNSYGSVRRNLPVVPAPHETYCPRPYPLGTVCLQTSLFLSTATDTDFRIASSPREITHRSANSSESSCKSWKGSSIRKGRQGTFETSASSGKGRSYRKVWLFPLCR